MALTSPIPAISAWTTFRRRSQSDRLLGAAISFTTGTGLGLEQSTILARQGRKGLSSSPEQLHNCCMSPERREENTVGLGMGSCIRCCAKVQHSDNVKIVQNWTYHNYNIFHFTPYTMYMCTTSYSLFQFSILSYLHVHQKLKIWFLFWHNYIYAFVQVCLMSQSWDN